MSELKNKIKNRLNEYTAEELGDTIDTMKQEVNRELPDMDPDEVEDVVAGAITGNDGEQVNETIDREYLVQFHSERNGEEPFYMDGMKWIYVNAIYPNGKKDIAVYNYQQDVSYQYDWFKENFIDRNSASVNEINMSSDDERQALIKTLTQDIESKLRGEDQELIDKIKEKMYWAVEDAYDELRRSGLTTVNIDEINKEVMNSFIDQYGKEQGEKIYYATANKQDRDPETFEIDEVKPTSRPRLQQKSNPEFEPSKPRPRLQQKSNPEFEPSKPRPRLQQKSNPMDEMDDEAVGRGIESGMNPESGIDYSEIDAVIAQINNSTEQGEPSQEPEGGENVLPFEEGMKPDPETDREIVKGMIGKTITDDLNGYTFKINGIHQFGSHGGHDTVEFNVSQVDANGNKSESKVLLSVDSVMDLLQGGTAEKFGYDSVRIKPMGKPAISETVNPRMTKAELTEAILGRRKPNVIKTIKVKDLRNE
jgi:hypothetical protein